MPAPFVDEVAQLVAQPHEQTFRVTATAGGTTYTLDVLDYVLDWTERRAPRVTLTATCAVPDQVVIDALDPRTYVVLTVWVGYRLGSGVLDEHIVAKLHLRERRISRPANTMVLTAASSEFLVLDQSKVAPGTQSDIQTWANGIVDMTQTYVNAYLEPGPFGTPTWVLKSSANVGPFQYDVAWRDLWDLLWDGLTAAGLDLFDDGTGVWHVEPIVTAAATDVAHDLSIGAGGTITASDAGLDRDEWANLVHVTYHWMEKAVSPTDGSVSYHDAWTYGRAQVTAGPYTEANSGLKVYIDEREGNPSQVQANAVAGQLLTRLLSRSRSLQIEAVSAWWLRPGDTVTAQLPTGPQERHIVAGVTFRTGGLMSVVTRLPDTVSTIGE